MYINKRVVSERENIFEFACTICVVEKKTNGNKLFNRPRKRVNYRTTLYQKLLSDMWVTVVCAVLRCISSRLYNRIIILYYYNYRLRRLQLTAYTNILRRPSGTRANGPRAVAVPGVGAHDNRYLGIWRVTTQPQHQRELWCNRW